MAIYALNVHENMLESPYFLATSMDVELMNMSDMRTEVYVGGTRMGETLFRFIEKITKNGDSYTFQDLPINHEPYEFRIISNNTLPYSLRVRITVKSEDGTVIGILCEHEICKVVD